jgi:hypothetical protein
MTGILERVRLKVEPCNRCAMSSFCYKSLVIARQPSKVCFRFVPKLWRNQDGAWEENRVNVVMRR